MSNDLVKQSIAELQDLVRCRCHDAYKGRGLHDPTCCCDYAEALKMLEDHIKELETRLKKAIEIADDLAYAHGKWIADIDYEEFYSWREDLN